MQKRNGKQLPETSTERGGGTVPIEIEWSHDGRPTLTDIIEGLIEVRDLNCTPIK